MQKLPQKYYNVTFSFLMAFIMSALMSFVVTSYNLGFSDDLLIRWLKAWRFAFIVAFPILLVVAPVVRKFTAQLIQQDK